MCVIFIWLLYLILFMPSLSLANNIVNIVTMSIIFIFSVFIVYGIYHPYSVEKVSKNIIIIGFSIIIPSALVIYIIDCTIISHPYSRSAFERVTNYLKKLENRDSCFFMKIKEILQKSKDNMSKFSASEVDWETLDQDTKDLDSLLFTILRISFAVFAILLTLSPLIFWQAIGGRNLDRFNLEC